MNTKTIVFTKPCTAELLEKSLPELQPGFARVRMEYTVISGGTERATIMGMPNTPQVFPTSLGYCGVGHVIETGEAVSKVKIGDRVLVYHGIHTEINTVPESDLTVVEQEEVDSLEAAFVVIASMGLGGTRKLELELGESAMVMGLGLLGMFAVQFERLSGANPVIAADPDPARRELALKLGADYALDPTAPDFQETVIQLTHGRGVNGTVEVTGISSAMKQALECASWLGRISLLGCTRVSDCGVDYYTQVHKPGVRLIGAHNFVRPKVESYPHHWTHHDDCRAILELLRAKRMQVLPMVGRIVKPEECGEIYRQLCEDRHFPLGTVFDWRDRA